MFWKKAPIKPCCVVKKKKSAELRGWSFDERRGAPAYAHISSDGFIEVASLEGEPGREDLSFFLDTFGHENAANVFSTMKKDDHSWRNRSIGSVALFFIIMFAEWFGVVSPVLTLLCGVFCLAVVATPKIYAMDRRTTLSLFTLLLSGGLWFLPLSAVLVMPVFLTLFSVSFITLVAKPEGDLINKGLKINGPYLRVCAWQLLVSVLSAGFGSGFVLLAPLPLAFLVYQSSNPHIDCDF